MKDRDGDRMIDLHAHILPQMDDGSPDVSTSVQMLRRMGEQGVTRVCASSHFYRDENPISVFCQRRGNAMARLERSGIMQEEGIPEILPAAEVAFFSGISEEPELERLCIEGTRTLLLEMPFCDWNDFHREEVSSLVLDQGYQVVLVHPERFLFSKENRWYIEQFQELPVAMQVNAGSLIRWKTRKEALKMLEEAAVPLIGSDAHNLGVRPPNIKEGQSVIQRKLGNEFWKEMQENAARLAKHAFAEV